MNPTKGYYSLIQYCPDHSRLEAANVGVLLFCPETRFIDACVARNNQRIVKFFGRGSFDPGRLDAAKQAVVTRLHVEAGTFGALSDLDRFIKTRGNEILITPPRPMKVRVPEEDLARLVLGPS